ncbi:hypothetical protein [Gracilimonas amylolytica]|uniref:hypothetical protein n=1 Tax=Gracilimonas amylolytica TaxID=1749045 RepID=UPI000CD9A23C|nr:hypothetical protein [Gracilimonas amylolytica]
MDTKTLKIELTRLILETESHDLLNRILKELKKEKSDFWLDLTEEQKDEIEISRKQVKNGETEDWESIIKRVS